MLQVYDYFLTLPDEVSLIWAAPWTPMKVLFLLTRYIPFIDGGIMLYCERPGITRWPKTQFVFVSRTAQFISSRIQPPRPATFPTKLLHGCFTSERLCLKVRRYSTAAKYSDPDSHQAILTLRTWAVWNRDRRLAVLLPIFFIVCWGPIIGVITVFLKSVESE